MEGEHITTQEGYSLCWDRRWGNRKLKEDGGAMAVYKEGTGWLFFLIEGRRVTESGERG